MKIVQVIPHLGEGGAERFVVDLANELSGRHEVVLCTLYDDPSLDVMGRHLARAVRVIRLGKRRGFDRRISPALASLLRAEKPDVAHSHLLAVNYLAPLSALFPKVRFFHTVHNDAFRETRGQAERAFRSFFFTTRLVRPVTISGASDESFRRAYPFAAPVLIPNGIRPPAAPPPDSPAAEEVRRAMVTPGTKVFVNVARIARQKNQIMLVRAFNRLVAAGHDVALLVVGGPKDAEGEVILAELERIRGPRVRLLGSRPDATDFLPAADGFCLSSAFEGAPISLLEALASGCTPVCSPAGGIPEVICHGRNGYLSAGFDEDSYVGALGEMLAAPDPEAIRAAARASFDGRYDISAAARSYEAAFSARLKLPGEKYSVPGECA